MNDEKKTREQLINELGELRQRITELGRLTNERMQMEEKLKNQAALAEQNPAPVLQVGYDGSIISFNPSAKEVFKKDLTKESLYTLFRGFKESIINAAKLEETLQLEQIIDEKSFLFTIKENKPTSSLYIYGSDITEKKKTEWELERHQYHLEELVKERTEKLEQEVTERKRTETEARVIKDHLDNIIESSLDCIIVTDSEGYITKANNSFKKLLGYEEEELIGKYAAEFSPEEDGIYECTTGESVEIDIEPYAQSQIKLMERLYENGKISNVETYYIRKDRQLVPVEVNSVILFNEEGDIIGAVGISRDITGRKRFERELKASEEKYRSLIENANDAIISANEEGEVVGFNKKAEEIFGYTCEEILGKYPFMFADPSRGEKGREKFAEFIRKRKTGLLSDISEKKGLRKDGTLIPIESYVFTIEVEGKLIITAIIRDITERKDMQHKLLQSEKLKSLGELAGGVAHNFNNALAVILGRTQLLKVTIGPLQDKGERRKSIIELKKGLETIERASLDGAETVRRIQEFARKRDDDKYFTSLDMNKVIDDALEFTKLQWKDGAESKGIKITVKKELSTLPSVSGSAAELREVLTNLIYNAIFAMPQGGTITVKTFKKGSYACIKVQDTGMGIPKAIQDKIFDPFFTTKGPQSSGLGMSVSYGIIERHRGTISADSAEGKGATFTIKLPFSEETVEERKVVPISSGQKKVNILIVEDEEDVRNVLKDILTQEGHRVETASNGKLGIEKFKKNNFDMVLTDLGMPGMSGWQVAEKIKAINGKVPIALITGWGIDLKKSEMKEKGIDFIVKKPYKLDQLVSVVQEGMILRERFKAV
jgi:PAS domain S-box-containing protein